MTRFITPVRMDCNGSIGFDFSVLGVCQPIDPIDIVGLGLLSLSKLVPLVYCVASSIWLESAFPIDTLNSLKET